MICYTAKTSCCIVFVPSEQAVPLEKKGLPGEVSVPPARASGTPSSQYHSHGTVRQPCPHVGLNPAYSRGPSDSTGEVLLTSTVHLGGDMDNAQSGPLCHASHTCSGCTEAQQDSSREVHSESSPHVTSAGLVCLSTGPKHGSPHTLCAWPAEGPRLPVSAGPGARCPGSRLPRPSISDLGPGA